MLGERYKGQFKEYKFLAYSDQTYQRFVLHVKAKSPGGAKKSAQDQINLLQPTIDYQVKPFRKG